jgi:hypothetical protein
MKILLGLHPQKIVKITGVFEEIFVVYFLPRKFFFFSKPKNIQKPNKTKKVC